METYADISTSSAVCLYADVDMLMASLAQYGVIYDSSVFELGAFRM
jgi:hypothetical protein